MATATGDILRLVRKGIDVKMVSANVRKPFRFYLCGDPALVAELRTFLLSGHTDESVPFEAAACLETLLPGVTQGSLVSEARVVIFLAAAATSQARRWRRCARSTCRSSPSRSTIRLSRRDRRPHPRADSLRNTPCPRSRAKRCAAV